MYVGTMTGVEIDFADKFIGAARGCIGRPFYQHNEGASWCDGGRVTAEKCMRRGMDDKGGYDYEGLAIASLCQVFDIDPANWPRSYRHAWQLECLASSDWRQLPGDLLLSYQSIATKGGEPVLVAQVAILSAAGIVIRASSAKNVVEEVECDTRAMRPILLSRMLAIGQSTPRPAPKQASRQRRLLGYTT